MAKPADGTRRGGPGGGSPKGERSPARRGGGRGRARGAYTLEERRHLLEAYRKSGMTVDAFCATVGVSTKTLCQWKKRFAQGGAKGLETRKRGRPPGSGKGSTLAAPVKEAIEGTKRSFPYFGLRRVRDFLARFLQLKVSVGGVRRVLAEAELPPAPRPPRRKRRLEEPRRFERSRPGELWQSDITSYLLPRHHVRVYLTVFLDDFSRFVVSWNLQMHQRQELVTDCLLAGIEAYGKPKEVLSDRGRQYYAWRGKSDFQKTLEKQGIAHVVAAPQHPQTVGKCERLWKTVGEELVDRARPQGLEEMRERLGHYFRHYNHFRPHQGLGGAVPADRFFGVADEVNKELERGQAANALSLALGEKPRTRDFLIGSLDGRPVAVRGGEDGLVIEHGDEESGKEPDHDERSEGEQARKATEAEAGGLPDAAQGGGGGEEPVGGGERGGEEAGARDGDGDPVVVAGGDLEGGGDGEAGGDPSSTLATGAAGAQRSHGGPSQAAEAAAGAAGVGGGDLEEEGRGAGEGAVPGEGSGDDSGGDAGKGGASAAGGAAKEGE